MMHTIEKVLIANRGEIAVRISKTLHKMGIDSVAVFSDADADALHVHSCDEAIYIGASDVAQSYLNQEKLIQAALGSGAQAIHPGYGFLSESSVFAQKVLDAGLIWIGPTPHAIEQMGDKAQAKKLMSHAGVPLAKGFEGEQDAQTLSNAAQEIGFPLLIKATAGGGGRGIRIVHSAAEFAEALTRAQSEARNAFGNDSVMLERFVENARHIEVQVFGDSHGNVVHLFERDCSLQRRRQKIVEEAPALAISEEVRSALCQAAVQAAQAISYVGAGTVEFLYDPASAEFYFLEMNTRLQVEHPVTEAITGQDLVAWQIIVAQGGALPCVQSDIQCSGHAIEVRLYAEDPAQNFLPASGEIAYWEPSHSSIRIDTGVLSGSRISSFYDPMIAKMIVHTQDRNSALRLMRHSLRHTPLLGCTNNRAFLHALLSESAVVQNNIDTGYVERTSRSCISSTIFTFAAVALLWRSVPSAWNSRGVHGWPVEMICNGEVVSLHVSAANNGLMVVYEGTSYLVRENQRTNHSLRVELDGHRKTLYYAQTKDSLYIDEDAVVSLVKKIDPYAKGSQEASSGKLVAPMMGRVVSVLASQGDVVDVGQSILVIEAMKMEHPVRAQVKGVLAQLHVQLGEQVSAEQFLGIITQSENES